MFSASAPGKASVAAANSRQRLSGSGAAPWRFDRDLVRREAHFGAVHAGGARAQRKEQPIEIGERATGDDRQRAAERTFEPGDRRGEFVGHHNPVGRCGDVEQRPVDVEEQRRALKIQIVGGHFRKVRIHHCALSLARHIVAANVAIVWRRSGGAVRRRRV